MRVLSLRMIRAAGEAAEHRAGAAARLPGTSHHAPTTMPRLAYAPTHVRYAPTHVRYAATRIPKEQSCCLYAPTRISTAAARSTHARRRVSRSLRAERVLRGRVWGSRTRLRTSQLPSPPNTPTRCCLLYTSPSPRDRG
eukprot:1525438-Rhodomonas_salina.1